MNLERSQTRIRELMSIFVAQVKAAAAMNQTDINKLSENVLLPLFKEIFGYVNLKNLNHTEKANYAAIDLGDEKVRIAIQVTSESDSEKIKDTLKKFVRYRLYEKFDRLIIYILTEKQKTYSGKGFDAIIQNSFHFVKTRDILDFKDLLKKVAGLQIEESSRIEGILEDNFGHIKPLAKKSELDEILKTLPPHLYAFTKEENWKINTSRSSLPNRTADTKYPVVNQDLISKIKKIFNVTRFFLIYGNSGRGKTFFSFHLIESIIDDYDLAIYYSPHLHSIGQQDTDSILNPIKKICSTGSRLLLVLDDGHLVPNPLKQKLLMEIQNPERDNIHLLLISRQQEEEVAGLSYSKDELMLNFNKIAEQTFNQIVTEFCRRNNINLDREREREILDRIKGPNLVFLTHFLRSWESLLEKDSHGVLSIDHILKNAYSDFLNYYEGSHHTESWRYINHVVSALFQYEIRIDKNYLTPEYNKNLANYGLDMYLKDHMIYKKQLSEGDKNRLYYVFMDFVVGEQASAMRHAAEFRFYLEAYQYNLTFGEKHGLDRKEFTKLVMLDYILFHPINIPEVEDRIQKNAEEGEREELLKSLLDDHGAKSAIDEGILKLLNQEP